MEIENNEQYIKRLRAICDTLDPYSPISKVDRKELSKLGIQDLEDPFNITNQLILLLENALEKQDTKPKKCLQ